jgi:hypothetical protein
MHDLLLGLGFVQHQPHLHIKLTGASLPKSFSGGEIIFEIETHDPASEFNNSRPVWLLNWFLFVQQQQHLHIKLTGTPWPKAISRGQFRSSLWSLWS